MNYSYKQQQENKKHNVSKRSMTYKGMQNMILFLHKDRSGKTKL